MLYAKDKNGKVVEVPTNVVELIEKQKITSFAEKRRLVKLTTGGKDGLELNPPPVEEQVANSGEWKQHTKKGADEAGLYLAIPSTVLPDGTTAQGVFIRAEVVPAILQEMQRLVEKIPS